MTKEEVLQQIKQLNEQGEAMNKKKLKKSHPELVRSALYSYPSWEHAIQEVGLS